VRRKLVIALSALGLAGTAALPGFAAPLTPTTQVADATSSAASAASSYKSPRPTPSRIVPPAVPTKVSQTPAGCRALAAKVRAGQLKNPPRNCVGIEMISNATAVEWPTNCSPTVTNTTPWIAVDRRNGCNHIAFFLIVTDLRTGEELGRSVLHSASKMIASTTDPSWAVPIDMTVRSSTAPIGRPTASTATFVPCPTDCTASGVSYGPTTASYWRGSAKLSAVPMVSNTWREHVGGYWHVTFSNPAWVATATGDFTTADSRCDNAYSRVAANCVFPNVPATMSFSSTANPEFYNHVQRALLSGLPGAAGSSTYLHRVFSPSVARQNGDTACPASLPRPTGMQCDEYPFRSTYEGAYTGGDPTPRSFPGCQMPDPTRTGPSGFSRCFINATQNQSAGAYLGNFYRDQRMLATDPFQITFV
jgi:hypothetical protein